MATTVLLDGDDWRLVGALPGRWTDPDLSAAVLADGRDWFPARVPGAVQDDLWRAGLIPDPYVGRNSLAIEWAADRSWVYDRTFAGDPAWRGRRAVLRFDGLDYTARILLNGRVLGEHASMTTPALFDVTDVLDLAGENRLTVVLAPAPVEQDQLGRTSLVTTRKSRMGYWWDFCPRLIDLGITGSVALELTGDRRIEDVAVHPRLAVDHRSAELDLAVATSGATPARLVVEIRRDDRIVTTAETDAGEGQARLAIRLEEPELWWPNGYGAQPLHTAVVRAVGPDGDILDERSTVFGLRTIELAPNETEDPLAPPYVFVVNGRRIWVSGWNWVPVDALYGRPDEERVEHLLDLAARAHCVLLRVNGVGRLETEHFYAACDRLGLLVWQEFLVTSSATDRKPSEDPDYLGPVVDEARRMVPLRRNHPSLAVWCAGNELESLDKLPLDDSEPIIAALREVATELDPDTVWLPTSAQGRKPFNGLSSIRRDPDGLHDVHGPWLYEGLTEQYELYNAGTSLFHSELGAEGITNPETVAAVLPDPAERSLAALDGPAWRHLSAWWVREAEWGRAFGPVDDLETLIAATQLLQAEGVRYALESNRRRAWRNSGSLPWQFDEPYPMLGSTAAVDYYGRPKELYWAIAEAYRPLALSLRYDTVAWGGREVFEVEAWAVTNGSEIPGAVLELRVLRDDGSVVAEERCNAAVEADGATRLGSFARRVADLGDGLVVVDLRLRTAGGGVLAEHRRLFSATADLAPLVRLPRQALEVVREAEGGDERITIGNPGATPAVAIRIAPAADVRSGAHLLLDADRIALLPGETRTLAATWAGATGDRRILVEGLGVLPVTVPAPPA